MYETLCSLSALLFQGLMASICAIIFAKLYEDSESRKRYHAATLFIATEVAEHLMILADMVAEGKLLPADSPLKFSIDSWLELRLDLANYLSLKDLEKASYYYRSISKILLLCECNADYHNHKQLICDTFTNAKFICDLFACESGLSNKQNAFSEKILTQYYQL